MRSRLSPGQERASVTNNGCLSSSACCANPIARSISPTAAAAREPDAGGVDDFCGGTCPDRGRAGHTSEKSWAIEEASDEVLSTVESHKANTMSKLGLNNRIDIYRFLLLK